MSNRSVTGLFIGLSLLLIPIALLIQASVWKECRADGHSFFYCMNLISGK